MGQLWEKGKVSPGPHKYSEEDCLRHEYDPGETIISIGGMGQVWEKGKVSSGPHTYSEEDCLRGIRL